MCGKKLLFLFFIIFSPFFYICTQDSRIYDCAKTSFCQNDPLIVVVIMVKNEESVINATLEPYVKAGIDSYLVFDTGSTDKTVETVRSYLSESGVKNAYIFEEPFIDFATSRNRALELAEQQFPHATFLLMIDAEWYMTNVEGLIKFCKIHVNDEQPPAYLVRMNNPHNDFSVPRLLRAHQNVRFYGDVHEIIYAEKKLPADIFFEYKPGSQGAQKSRQRWLRDVEILLKKYNENPFDSRNTFYLAQTYECLGDLYNAYKYYQLRSQQLGWDEENYETFYRLGRVCNALSILDTNFTWHMAFDYYMQAYKMRPHRAEPLVKIAEHYWPDNVPMCYVFVRRALDLPYPDQERLFIDKEIYEYTRYEILSKTAWWVGEFEVGEMATHKALSAKPYMTHLQRNLQCYVDRKNGKIA